MSRRYSNNASHHSNLVPFHVAESQFAEYQIA